MKKGAKGGVVLCVFALRVKKIRRQTTQNHCHVGGPLVARSHCRNGRPPEDQSHHRRVQSQRTPQKAENGV